VSQLTALQPGVYYHIFNRGNNREAIFREKRNYRLFLDLYRKHVAQVVDTFAYCLLPNHFHFLVHVRQHASRSYGNMFNAYAKSFNQAYSRSGSLFEKPFRRVPVIQQEHLFHLVGYIHHNPQRHGLVENFETWPYHSYETLISERDTFLLRNEVMLWFGGKQSFIQFHRQTEMNGDPSGLERS
jgi:putative transposase